MRQQRQNPPQPLDTSTAGPRQLSSAETIVVALVDVIAMTAPPILTHVLLEWTVLACIIAAQTVVLLALFMATFGRTPGLKLVSAVVMAVPTGTPNIGQSLVRVVLTPLLPIRRRMTSAAGAPSNTPTTANMDTATGENKTMLLDALTHTSTTTSRPAKPSAAKAFASQNSTTPSGPPRLGIPATVTTGPVLHTRDYASGGALATTPHAPPTGSAYGTQGRPSFVVPAPAPPQPELPQSFPPVSSGGLGTLASVYEPAAAPPLAPAPGAPATAPLPTAVKAPIGGNAAPLQSAAPPLYRIVINASRRLPLEGQCILGREPRALSPEDVQLVTVDTSTAVSRSHLRIGVAGAGPWAEDLGSANGSALLRSDGTQTQLVPGVRTPLGPGGAVLLADGVQVAIEASRRARRAQHSS